MAIGPFRSEASVGSDDDGSSGQTPRGAQCSPPEFSVDWLGQSTAVLRVVAEPAGRFAVDFEFQQEPADAACGEEGFSYPGSVIVDSRRSAAEALLNLTDCHMRRIIQSNGYVFVHWRELFDDTETEDATCEGRKSGRARLAVMSRHLISIDVGKVFALAGDGTWSSQSELALSASSRWTRAFSGVVDIRYSGLPALEEETSGSTDGGGDVQTLQENTPAFNPFASSGGLLRGDVYGVVYPSCVKALKPFHRGICTPAFGILAGVGLSSVQSDDKQGAYTRSRWFAGLRVQVSGYNAAERASSLGTTRGYVQFGYAYDDRWQWTELASGSAEQDPEYVQRSEKGRLFLEGQLELPQVGTQWLRLLVRLYADLPSSKKGPSDIRVSALASIKPDQLRTIFSGVGAAN